MEKTPRILFELVRRLDGEAGRTVLMKILYLCDLESRRWRGRPLTEFDWIHYEYGPFDSRFYRHVHALQEAGYLAESRGFFGGVKYRLVRTGPPPAPDLSEGDLAIMRAVVRRFGGLSAGRIKGHVYGTEPMIRSRGWGHPLPMSAVDRTGPATIPEIRGFEDLYDHDAIARGDAEFERGEVLSDEAVERELRARVDQ